MTAKPTISMGVMVIDSSSFRTSRYPLILSCMYEKRGKKGEVEYMDYREYPVCNQSELEQTLKNVPLQIDSFEIPVSEKRSEEKKKSILYLIDFKCFISHFGDDVWIFLKNLLNERTLQNIKKIVLKNELGNRKHECMNERHFFAFVEYYVDFMNRERPEAKWIIETEYFMT